METEVGFLEIQLNLPEAETYTLGFPPEFRGGKKLYEYVKQFLVENHPGFSEESLWDYRCIKKDGEKTVFAVVLEKDFYLEKTLSEKHVLFYAADESGKRVRFFRKKDFDGRGERKKKSVVWPVVFILIAAAAAVLLTVEMKRDGKAEEEEPQITYEKQTEEAVDGFDLFHRCAKVIENHGGKVKLVSYNTSADQWMLDFSLSGCEPYSLVQDIEKHEDVKSAFYKSVVYEGGEEIFEVFCRINEGIVMQENLNENQLLYLQDCIVKRILESRGSLVTTSTDAGSGRISFEIECEGRNLGAVNEKLQEICREENLFITSFLQGPSGAKGRFLTVIEVVKLEKSQKLKKIVSEEKLSKIFDREKDTEKNEVFGKEKSVKKNTDEAEVKQLRTDGKKIGSVRKEGKSYVYYRSEDGKVLIKEESDE